MRPAIVPAIALWLAACSEPRPPALRQVAIWAPGLDITIDVEGNGRYLNRSNGEHRCFLLASKQLDDLIRRMEVFRRSPQTMAGEDVRAFSLRGVPCDGPYVTDNGGMSIRWLGTSVDQFYSADFGCDRDRYAARNKELRAILKSLPVPEPQSLP
ncbi:hypothetical protein FHS94_003430 [Sphingomonas aerophila]|uniref:Lipoprotein n=1 Tax=Sphingomonas aerophila TaxID=1344948 RepID=A0A7W9BG06_9SPHN|nr:hypothetical protein [Sphingomonas aerophila]